MNRRIAVGMATLSALAACADADRQPRGEPTLIGGSASSADTVEPALSGAVRATWQRSANGWAAIGFVIVSADDGRRMIERLDQ